MRITEFFQVLPALLFAMVVVTLFSPSMITIAIAIGLVLWPQTARLTRAEFLKIRELEYVTAARSIGARNGRIMWKVILPNALPPLIVSATLTWAWPSCSRPGCPSSASTIPTPCPGG